MDVRDGGEAAPGRLRLFVNYRRHETAPYAGRLYDELVDHFGDAHVFMDVNTIELGTDFTQAIDDTIACADVVLVVLGPSWLTLADDAGNRRLDDPTDFVRRELEAALRLGKRVIPLLVDHAVMPDQEALPEPLRAFARRQASTLSNEHWRSDVAELIRALEDLAARRAAAPSTDDVPAWSLPGPPARQRVAQLPTSRTRFVARDDDIDHVAELLAATGLVTIVGPGGVGKSRLALEAARRIQDRYADGIAVVELAAIAEPALVVPTIMRATGSQAVERDATVETLLHELADRQLLLILDNCEHVIDDAATVAEALVEHCPGLQVLATSREALQVNGEAVWQLDPLALPDLDSPELDPATSPAVQLFADRAALASADFELTEATAASVARLVVALDGLPLAIELAASSLRSVGLESVIADLVSDVPTVAARRTTNTRQRTLWATVDWSTSCSRRTSS